MSKHPFSAEALNRQSTFSCAVVEVFAFLVSGTIRGDNVHRNFLPKKPYPLERPAIRNIGCGVTNPVHPHPSTSVQWRETRVPSMATDAQQYVWCVCVCSVNTNEPSAGFAHESNGEEKQLFGSTMAAVRGGKQTTGVVRASVITVCNDHPKWATLWGKRECLLDSVIHWLTPWHLGLKLVMAEGTPIIPPPG